MAPHSSTLAWKIPWTAEPGRPQTMGSLRVTTERLHFHTLEKEMATHSSVLAWRIPGTGEPGGLSSMGSHRVGCDWSDLVAAAAASISYISHSLILHLYFFSLNFGCSYGNTTHLIANYHSFTYVVSYLPNYRLFEVRAQLNLQVQYPAHGK